MCFFHKWTTWSEVYIEIWSHLIDTETVRKYSRDVQKRSCKKCNETQLRYLN